MVTQGKDWQFHEPVMVDEVLSAYGLDAHSQTQDRKKIIDATLGFGGHTAAFVQSGADVLAIEADEETFEIAHVNLKTACPPHLLTKVGSYTIVNANFVNLAKIANENGFSQVDGVLFDLGVSSYQLTSDTRGFSFQSVNADLDMRLSRATQGIKASDLLNVLSGDDLTRLFSRVLDGYIAKRLTKEVVKTRSEKKFETVGDFLAVLNRVDFRGKKTLNKATLPFLALRIAVNSELENLMEVLPEVMGIVKPLGRIVVITFHSGEDQLVKTFFKKSEKDGLGRSLTKKPILPTLEEIGKNPRARSAKMRIFEKSI